MFGNIYCLTHATQGDKMRIILFCSLICASCAQTTMDCSNGQIISYGVCMLDNVYVSDVARVERIIEYTIDKFAELKGGKDKIIKTIGEVPVYLHFTYYDELLQSYGASGLTTFPMTNDGDFQKVDVYVEADQLIENCLELSSLSHEFIHVSLAFLKGAKWTSRNINIHPFDLFGFNGLEEITSTDYGIEQCHLKEIR
jgi:hypothetical protein